MTKHARRPEIDARGVSSRVEEFELVPGSEISIAARLLAAVRKIFRRPDPVNVLRYREKMKREFREKLDWSNGHHPEIILIPLSKSDSYPELESGIFKRMHWGKYEVKRPHDKGLEIHGLAYGVTIRKNKARIPYGDRSGTVTVFPVTRIPYERIAHVDWSADPVYGLPRVYAVYRRKFRKQTVVYRSASFKVPSGMPDPFGDLDLELMEGVKFQGYGGNPYRWVRNKLVLARLRWKHRGKDSPRDFDYDTH